MKAPSAQADDDRDHERQEEKREQQLAGPARSRHRRQQRPYRGKADAGQRPPPATSSQLTGWKKRAKAGSATISASPRNATTAITLPSQIALRSRRRQNEAVEYALLALRGKRAREPENGP